MRSDVGGGQLYKKRSDPGLRAPVRASSRASPAPTFDRVSPLECGRMWEVVSCTKRSDPETVVPALPSSRASPAPTFDRVPPLECGRMWERACPRMQSLKQHMSLRDNTLEHSTEYLLP